MSSTCCYLQRPSRAMRPPKLQTFREEVPVLREPVLPRCKDNMPIAALDDQKADSPTLKRSFSPDIVYNHSFSDKRLERGLSEPCILTPTPLPRWRTHPGHTHRGPLHSVSPRTRLLSMPLKTTVRPYAAPMPSFMSVFGGEVNSGLQDLAGTDIQGPHGEPLNKPATSGHFNRDEQSLNAPFSIFHQQRDSTSTSASDSTESSPTTTISTMDGSALTEPSPAPSPESPAVKAPPTSFSPDFKPRRAEGPKTDLSGQYFELARPTTPARKARNLKNLAVNTSGTLGLGRAISTASLPLGPSKDTTTSAPTSPSFVKPPTPPARRKPGQLGLSIKTPGNGSMPRLAIPPTPSFKRPITLRHFQSSPSLPLLSPGPPPEGGMQFPPLKQFKPVPHGFSEVLSEDDEEEPEPNFDVPQSREEKPAAYPNGPIRIYESGVYLYFEPAADIAANFDVILNVASEVKNPFNGCLNYSVSAGSANLLDPDAIARSEGFQLGNRLTPSFHQNGSIHQHHSHIAAPVPKTDGVASQQESESPSTPKATPILEHMPSMQNGGMVLDLEKSPEYIHIPWEHNTDIVPDLLPLVKVIDDRVRKGKRVLVHCQCGVSRSASLIVAYGIYKNLGISVQEAYDAVKKRSKWIGPNMNLIMQLQEFRNGLLRPGGVFGLVPRKHSAGLSSAVSVDRHPSPFASDTSKGARTPRTAPLPAEDMANQRASTGNMAAISPGPLSAPSDMFGPPGFRRSWDVCQTHFDLSTPQSPAVKELPYVDTKGHVVPVLASADTDGGFSMSNGSDNNNNNNKNDHQENMHYEQSQQSSMTRQLPFRQERDHDNDHHMTGTEQPTPVVQTIIHQQSSLLSQDERERQDSFGLVPLQPGNFADLSTKSLSVFPLDAPRPRTAGSPHRQTNPFRRRPPELTFQLASPRSQEFHMTALEPQVQQAGNDPFGITSPRKSDFSTNPFRRNEAQSEEPQEQQPPQQFPNLVSPRSEEFHMAPFRPAEAAEESFGLTSPRSTEFPKNLFDDSPPTDRSTGLEMGGDTFPLRYSRVEPVSQPATEPHSHGGMISLNSIMPTQTMHHTGSIFDPTPRSEAHPAELFHPEPTRITNTSDPLRAILSDKPNHSTSQVPTPTPQKSQLLSTPPRGLRTRFSSPNIQEQMRLQRLQSEIESRLPNRSPGLAPVADDLDSLMSPRASEFTSNPFHIQLLDATQTTKANNPFQTPKKKETTVEETKWPTPKDSQQDPRSPAHKGSSPITRNIWDVL